MCQDAPLTGSPERAARRLEEIRASRRTVLTAAASGLGGADGGGEAGVDAAALSCGPSGAGSADAGGMRSVP
ncbi:MAG: hypothetical protein ACPF9W_13025, partial [Nocardioides sp.]